MSTTVVSSTAMSTTTVIPPPPAITTTGLSLRFHANVEMELFRVVWRALAIAPRSSGN
jgi:hypothetical protein